MDNVVINSFCELDNEELITLDGGIGVGVATLIVAGALVRCAATGFVAGCVYEAILG